MCPPLRMCNKAPGSDYSSQVHSSEPSSLIHTTLAGHSSRKNHKLSSAVFASSAILSKSSLSLGLDELAAALPSTISRRSTGKTCPKSEICSIAELSNNTPSRENFILPCARSSSTIPKKTLRASEKLLYSSRTNSHRPLKAQNSDSSTISSHCFFIVRQNPSRA